MKKLLLNTITLFLFLIFFELTSFLVLRFNYSYYYERYSSSFFFKPISNKAMFSRTQADYFALHPIFGVKFKPNSDFFGLSPDENGFPVYIEKNGLRTDELGYVSTSKRSQLHKDVFKILVSGGSTTAGWGASKNGTTWPSVLEKKVQKYFEENSIPKTVKVINSGVLGYNMSQEVQQYLTETQFLDPDLVISFSGINEKWDYLGNPIDYSLSGHHYRMLNLMNGKVDFNIKGFLPNIRLLTKVISNNKKPLPYGYKSKDFKKKDSIELYLRKAQNLKDLVAGQGKDFLYVLQPLMGVCPQNLKKNEIIFKNFFGHEFYPQSWENYIGRARGFYEKVQEKLGENWQLNLTCVFENIENDVYYDPRHYNDFGQQVIAESIYQSILTKGHLK